MRFKSQKKVTRIRLRMFTTEIHQHSRHMRLNQQDYDAICSVITQKSYVYSYFIFAASKKDRVAQLVEQRPFKPWVLGSNPSAVTILSQES